MPLPLQYVERIHQRLNFLFCFLIQRRFEFNRFFSQNRGVRFVDTFIIPKG